MGVITHHTIQRDTHLFLLYANTSKERMLEDITARNITTSTTEQGRNVTSNLTHNKLLVKRMISEHLGDRIVLMYLIF